MFGKKKKLSELKSTVDVLTSKIDSLTDTIDDKETEIKRLLFENERFSSRCDSLQSENNDLKATVGKLESIPDREGLSAYIQSVTENFNSLIKKKNDEISSYLAIIRKQKAQLSIAELSEGVSDFKNALSELKHLHSQLSDLAKKINRLEDRLSSIAGNYQKDLKRLFAKHVEIEVADSHLSHYRVLYQEEGRTQYTLPADIREVTFHYFERSSSGLSYINKTHTIFFLECVYWPRRGYSSFIENPRRIYPNKPIILENHRGKPCKVTLTDTIVPQNQSEINLLNEKSNFVKNAEAKAKEEIHKLCSDAEKAFPYFAGLLADYEYLINSKFANYLENKNHPAFKTGEKIKELARTIKRLRKKCKTLEYQCELLNSKVSDSKGTDNCDKTNP